MRFLGFGCFALATLLLLLCLAQRLRASGLGRRRRAAAGGESCQPTSQHHESFGSWASRRNTSHHHLSLILPSLHGKAGLRRILEEELEENPILTGGTDCPLNPVTLHDEPIMLRSICPWYWKLHYDPRRIPSVLPEAVCRCRKAVTGSSSVVFQCQPLTLNIRVLKLDEECEDYREESVEISVACVSVMQPQHHMDKMSGIESVQTYPTIEN